MAPLHLRRLPLFLTSTLLLACAAAGACSSGSDGGSDDATVDPSRDGGVHAGDDDDDAPVGDGGEPATDGSVEAGPNCGYDTLELATTATRGSDTPVLRRGSYDYTPSIMHDGRYRMYWCGGVAGDHILYSTATSLDGPWSTPISVLVPTGVPGTFDRTHTCDPSVIRVDGVYYLYYGGLDEGESKTTQTTRLGVATSQDGITWTRANAGKPIVVPARPITGLVNQYGAGQPSVTYVDGKFYLMYTDTTGRGGNQGNGAGQYVWRSSDPIFQKDVEELTKTGFTPRNDKDHTSRSLTEAFSADIQFVDSLDAFVVAVNASSKLDLRFFDRAMNPIKGGASIPGTNAEGPGIVGRPDRHAIPSTDPQVLHVDLLHAIGPAVASWDLAHHGGDVKTDRLPACVDMGKVFEGSLIAAAGRPLTMIRDGKRIQFAASAPAVRLARASYDVSVDFFDRFPYGASMRTGATVLSAPDRPGAFLLDDGKLYPFDCLELVTENGSSLTSVTTAEWDKYPRGSPLRCLH